MILKAGRFFWTGATLSLVFWGTVAGCGPGFEEHEKAWHIKLTKNLDPKRAGDNPLNPTYTSAYLLDRGYIHSEFADPKTAASPVYRTILTAHRRPANSLIVNGLLLIVLMVLDRFIGKADNASGCGWFVVFTAIVLFFWGVSVYSVLQSGIEIGYGNLHEIPDEVLNP